MEEFKIKNREKNIRTKNFDFNCNRLIKLFAEDYMNHVKNL